MAAPRKLIAGILPMVLIAALASMIAVGCGDEQQSDDAKQDDPTAQEADGATEEGAEQDATDGEEQSADDAEGQDADTGGDTDGKDGDDA